MRTLAVLCAILGAAASQSCPAPDGLFGVAGECDRYLECHAGVGEEKLCPDGLVFDDQNSRFRWPCDYPQLVDCGTRTALQLPQPTADCPNQFGMFRSADPTDCGTYFNCVYGRAYRIPCPEGLVFNQNNLRCDWPDSTTGCDLNAFLGFSCPQETPQRLAFTFLFGHPRYGKPDDCQKFFICINGKNGPSPRLQSCGYGSVFSPKLNGCTDEPETVPGCENYYPPEVLEEIRRRRQRYEELEQLLDSDFDLQFV